MKHCRKSPFFRPVALRSVLAAAAIAITLTLGAGCYHVDERGERLVNSLPGVRVVVVAPAMNLSTNTRVDLVSVTNAFSSELAQVEGLTVVPVGRVYEFLVRQQQTTVGSPEEARALAAAFGADATIVLAVTEYDVYYPPRVGLAAQLYRSSLAESSSFDPVSAARNAAEFSMDDAALRRPNDQVSRVFSGRNREVEELARLYSRERLSDDSPHGWRRFIVAQEEFVRLCSYGVIREMLGPQGRVPLESKIKPGPRPQGWPQ